MRITKPEILKRNWGSETVVVKTPTHAGKILRRKMDTKGGFQCHVKEESHYLVDGVLHLEWIEHNQIKSTQVMAGQGWTVPPLTFHRETALTDCIVFEVSDPTSDDRYGLIPDPGALPSMTDDQAVCILTTFAEQLEQRARTCRQQAKTIKQQTLASLRPDVPIDA